MHQPGLGLALDPTPAKPAPPATDSVGPLWIVWRTNGGIFLPTYGTSIISSKKKEKSMLIVVALVALLRGIPIPIPARQLTKRYEAMMERRRQPNTAESRFTARLRRLFLKLWPYVQVAWRGSNVAINLLCALASTSYFGANPARPPARPPACPLALAPVARLPVGDTVGLMVGLTVGEIVGLTVGLMVGEIVGLMVGLAVGLTVRSPLGSPIYPIPRLFTGAVELVYRSGNPKFPLFFLFPPPGGGGGLV